MQLASKRFSQIVTSARRRRRGNNHLQPSSSSSLLPTTILTNYTNDSNMMFKSTSSTIAMATFVTLSNLQNSHIVAFTPSITKTTMNTMNQNQFILQQRFNNNSINKNGNDSNNKMYLSSSVAPEIETTKEDTTMSSSSSTTATTAAAVKPTVVATAISKSFIPSPNGLSGVMAVQLMEEDYDPTKSSSSDTNASTAPKVEGDEALLSQTGMFGGNMNNQSTSKKSIEVEDLVGKSVQFGNGKTGTIIVQRPPMAFVLCDFAEWDNNSITENNNNKEEEEEKGNDSSEIISIMSSRTSIPVNEDLFGNIVDCYGNYQDQDINKNGDNGANDDTLHRAIFAPIPQIKDIALINSPLLTGTAMIDALAPIGKGQNMLFIGQDTGVGQRDVLIGAIKTQVNQKINGSSSSSSSSSTGKNNNVKCVYALTTQDKKVREEVIKRLEEEGLLDHIVLVTARDHGCSNGNDENEDNVLASAEAITTAAAACSIAETLALSQGDDTFVVVDDIDDHKSFWDWTTRVLVDIYGVDAVVQADISGGASSEMRGFYSSLIQRAGRFNEKNGGGSMTLALLTNLVGNFGGDDDDEENITFSEEDFADSSEKIRQRIEILVQKKISLTPETLRKIQIPVPVASEAEKKRRLALQHVDDLVSMSDGQVWFDETLYANGQRPAIDPQQSITRVGVGADTPCRADAPAMRGLAGGLRFDFAQAASLEGADEKSGAEKQLLKRDAYLLAMHQNPGDVRLLSENCVALMASSLGLLNKTVESGGKAGSDVGNETIQGLLNHIRENAPNLMDGIDESFDLTPSTRSELEVIIKDYLS